MSEWRYESAQDLDQPMLERLRHFPREPDMTVYGLRSVAALVVRGWLATYHRFKVSGRQNIPASGSFVMVANHASHLDTLCLLSALPLRTLHRAFPAAARDYFFVSSARTAVAAIFVNALPFERQLHIRQSLQLCRHLLANPGNILIIYPEGTRTLNGRMNEFRPGIGWLVAGSQIPVLPCYLNGCFRALPKGKYWPRPCRLQLEIGAPRTYPTAEPHEVARDLWQAGVEMEAQHRTN